MLCFLKVAGGDIKSLVIRNFEFNFDQMTLAQVFMRLPALEKISLEEVYFKSEDREVSPINRELLANLKELNIVQSEIRQGPSVLELFNNISSTTVMRKLFLPCNKNGRLVLAPFYTVQRNIEHLQICSCFKNFFSLDALPLLSKLEARIHSEDDLQFMCKNLSSVKLVGLEMQGGVEQFHESSFAKLPNLQTLCLSWSTMGVAFECLHRIYSSSVKTLKFRAASDISECHLPDLTVSTLGRIERNLPQLEHLSLSLMLSTNCLNTIIKYSRGLKKLTFLMNYYEPTMRNYIFEDNLRNESLTALVIKGYSSVEILMTEDISKLLGACINLTWFETSVKMNSQILRSMLTHQPNLTTLLLYNRKNIFSIEFVEILKAFGKKLNHVICTNSLGDRNNFRKLIKQEFRHQFKNINYIAKLRSCEMTNSPRFFDEISCVRRKMDNEAEVRLSLIESDKLCDENLHNHPW